MNEKWASFVYTISVLGIVVVLIVSLFEKPRKWLIDFIIKTTLTKENQTNTKLYFEKYRLRSTIKKAQERLAEIEGQIKPHIPMTDNTRNIIIACIITSGLILSTIIYAFSTRYVIDKPIRIDRWTGTYQMIKKGD